MLVLNLLSLGLCPDAIFPRGNVFNKDKVALGKILFFDPRLSGSGQMACASCHDPDHAWTDGRTVSFGNRRKRLVRNAPSVMFSGQIKSQFLDGRTETLEEQSLQVVANPDEMHHDMAGMVRVLKSIKGYEALFLKSFGDIEITDVRVGKAIATFERTINGGSSRFDRFVKGGVHRLSDDEIMGLDVFRRKGSMYELSSWGYVYGSEIS